jgi:tetratricopeptide (TPR) repeat protein
MTKSFLGTFALIFASMAGLFVFDTFLEKAEQAERRAEAKRLYHEGQALLQRGRAGDAVEQFRDALTFARENPGYELALAQALLESGKLHDAEVVVSSMLERDPTDGPANLTMARIFVKEGKDEYAGSYYHRAIYGHWPEDTRDERLKVRLELIDLLSRENDRADLLAELLPLPNEKLDLKTREHIALLYLQAGSPNRAAELYRGILHENPSNPDAFAGLGNAEFALGNYPSAHVDFLVASRRNPANAEVKKQLELSGEVLALDPSLRGLSAKDRYQRSQHLLDLARQSLSRCSDTSAPDSAQNPPLRPGQENEATEANLDLAETIWQARKNDCKQPVSDQDQALSLVLSKMVQR